ncbi:MAG: bacteriohemerythrin [Gammaproteobacteria bacterium]|nr:bacteriohemerythrin [Gammaproteobacteria bacterium]
MAQTFQWTERFETGLTEVDDQHRHLVDIINAIGERVRENLEVPVDDIAALYRDLRDYAVYHFAEEERLMVQEGLDGGHVEQHQAQHRYYLAEVERLYGRLSAEAVAEIRSILKFLTSWLVYHILGTDQAMARQMERIHAGMTPRQALLAEADERRDATEPLLAALNGLFEQVAERNRELEALNEDLEHRVATRTEELAGLVARLEAEKVESPAPRGGPGRGQPAPGGRGEYRCPHRPAQPSSCHGTDGAPVGRSGCRKWASRRDHDRCR